MRLYGKDHHHTVLAQNSLAGACADAGDLDRAIRLYEQAFEAALRVLGESIPIHESSAATLRTSLSAAKVNNLSEPADG